MKMIALAAALAMTTAATAQTTTETKVSNTSSMKDGVVTNTHKVVHVKKRKTRHAKRILGVKVGHKTAKTKVVRTTTTNSSGDSRMTVKTTH